MVSGMRSRFMTDDPAVQLKHLRAYLSGSGPTPGVRRRIIKAFSSRISPSESEIRGLDRFVCSLARPGLRVLAELPITDRTVFFESLKPGSTREFSLGGGSAPISDTAAASA